MASPKCSIDGLGDPYVSLEKVKVRSTWKFAGRGGVGEVRSFRKLAVFLASLRNNQFGHLVTIAVNGLGRTLCHAHTRAPPPSGKKPQECCFKMCLLKTCEQVQRGSQNGFGSPSHAPCIWANYSLDKSEPLPKNALARRTSVELVAIGLYVHSLVSDVRVPLVDYPKVDLNPGVVDFPNRETHGFKSTLSDVILGDWRSALSLAWQLRPQGRGLRLAASHAWYAGRATQQPCVELLCKMSLKDSPQDFG